LCFVILALNCKALLLGALVVAMLASLLGSWQEFFRAHGLQKSALEATLEL